MASLPRATIRPVSTGVKGLSFALALAGCSGRVSLPTGTGGGGGPGQTASVTIQDYAFTPALITIRAGTTVNWTNDGPSSHSATADSTGGFDSGAIAAPMNNGNGGLFQMHFTTPGTYTYHCMFHAQMHGTITVQ